MSAGTIIVIAFLAFVAITILKVYELFHKAINGSYNVWVNTTPHLILA